MNPRLGDLLNNLNKIEHAHFVKMPHSFTDGYFNFNNVYKVTGVTYQYVQNEHPEIRTVPQPLSVIISKPKPEVVLQFPRFLLECMQAQALIHQRNIKPHFNHSYLFRDASGMIISQYAEENDLFYFVNKYKHTMDIEMVKNLFGQLLLAVHHYHDQGIVHRDIKPDNFLVYIIDGKPILKLADQDSTIAVDPFGHETTLNNYTGGTARYTAPEIMQLYIQNEQLTKFNHPNHSYGHIDWLAGDCYSVGISFATLLVGLLKQDLLEKITTELDKHYYIKPYLDNGKVSPFYMMHTMLTASNPNTRWTISQAMDSELFGATEEIRKAFFQQRINNANWSLCIDGYHFIPNNLAPSDPFYLLDSRMKFAFSVAYNASQAFNNFLAMNRLHYTFDSYVEMLQKYKLTLNLSHAVSRESHTAVTDNLPLKFSLALTVFELNLVARLKQVDDCLTNNFLTALKMAVNKSIGDYRNTLSLTTFNIFSSSWQNPINEAAQLHAKFIYLTDCREGLNLIRQFMLEALMPESFKAIILKNVLVVLHKPLADFIEPLPVPMRLTSS